MCVRTFVYCLAPIWMLACPSSIMADDSPAQTAAQSFSLTDVKLLDGPFLDAMRADAKWLLSLDCDRLLSWYRKEAGLEPKGRVYGGWESRGIAGHSLGHYLSACARMYQTTGKQEFRRRVDYLVTELAACQQANGDGFLGAMPDGKKIFDEVARGDIRSAGFDLNGSWVPWYNLHKLYAGLIDAHLLCDNEQALEVVKRLADWAIEITHDLTPDQWQRMLACEFGGMNESLAQLWEITGNDAYLELARKFYHQAILDPLAQERDDLQGKHANTQIPKVVGLAKLASLTGDKQYDTAARFFWQTMVDNHSYVTGGNSIGEHLGPPGKLNDRLGPTTTETCNTYNMLKLTAELFAQQPSAQLTDYAERAIWNHILASQNPNTGGVCYFVPLQTGAHKPFMGPETFTCCSGSGMENHARYGEYIYAKSEGALYVNQYLSSELDWQDQDVQVRQLSEFPERGNVRLEINCAEPTKFALHLRHPFWCEQGYRVSVNGEKIETESEPASYATLEREWKSGDVLEIEMPMTLRTEAMPDNSRRVAVFHGPILLAGLLGDEDRERLAVLVTDDRPVGEWLANSDEDVVAFRTQDVGRPRDFTLVPFCNIVDDHYVVYWDIFTESQWQSHQAEYEAELARVRELEARTVDLFVIGEMQPERDHNVQGEKTSAGEFGNKKFRHAWDGGWFSFEVPLPKDESADLVITYWGGESGNRTFDVLVEGEKLATQALHQDKPGQFWDRVYELPKKLTTGKSKVTVKFQAHPDNWAGGVFGVRVTRRNVNPAEGRQE